MTDRALEFLSSLPCEPDVTDWRQALTEIGIDGDKMPGGRNEKKLPEFYVWRHMLDEFLDAKIYFCRRYPEGRCHMGIAKGSWAKVQALCEEYWSKTYGN